MTNLEQLFTAVVAIATSGTIWKFVEARLKMKNEQKNKELQSSDSTLYRTDLQMRVEKLSQDLEEAQAKILALTEEVAELRIENKFLQKEIERLKDK